MAHTFASGVIFSLPACIHSINPQARVAGRHAGPNMEKLKFETEG
jgi:hypothetical protein